MSVFDEYARYYDLLYRDKDYEGEANYVHGLIQRFGSGAKSILELGCGTGKHGRLLAANGYQIHGIDQSPVMLERARAAAAADSKLAAQLSFDQGDIRDYRVARKFDVAVSLFHVVSYLTKNEDLKKAFSTAREHLNPGGLFLFDVWHGPCVLTEPPAVRVKRMENDQISIMRVVEPELRANDSCVALDYTIFIRDKQSGQLSQIAEKHCMRYLFAVELQELLAQAGLDVIGSAEWMTDCAPGTHTFGVWYVAKAV